MLPSLGNRAECALLVNGDNYSIDFNISKHHILLIIHFRQKRYRRKKSCNKKIFLKNHAVIHWNYWQLMQFYHNLQQKTISLFLQLSFGEWPNWHGEHFLTLPPSGSTQDWCHTSHSPGGTHDSSGTRWKNVMMYMILFFAIFNHCHFNEHIP